MSDVIVVGAGPAGAASAILLAERGFDVLVLDRAAFPRPKLCDPRGKERLEAVAERRAVRERHHDAHVDAAGRDRVEDRVVRRIDEDLADVASVRESGDVRHEGHACECVRPP